MSKINKSIKFSPLQSYSYRYVNHSCILPNYLIL